DATTGALTWAPGASVSTGTYTIPFSVADNATPARTASGTFQVLVGAAGQPLPPALSTLPFESITIGSTLTADLSTYAQDLNTPPLPLTFSLGNDAPAGASISASGTLTWAVPADETAGQVKFTVIVSDNQSPPVTASGQITVYVNGVQAPSVVGNIPDQAVTIGDTLTFNLSNYAFDPNNPPLPLTFTLGATAPSGASLNASTGVFTWTPDASVAVATYAIPFTVADNSSPPLTASGSFNVKVGVAGTIFDPVLQALPTGLATIGLTLTQDLSGYASDPNTPPLPLTFSLGNDAPAGASISASGTLTWAVPADEAAGQVTFHVIVSDNQATPATAQQPITFNVQAIQPPSISTSIPTVDATTGKQVTVRLAQYVYDPNNPSLPLTYALGTGALADASVDATTGVFTWTPSAADGTGTITIPFTVSDNQSPPHKSDGTLTFSVAAPAVQPPAFGTIPTQQVTVGETLSLDASQYASDPNSPPLPLTYSLGNDAPQGATIDATTGVMTWATTSSTAVQQYAFTVIAKDNSSPANSGQATLTVNVLAVQAPTIAAITGPTAAAGTSASLDLSKSVTDKNTPALPLTFSLASGPAGAAISSAGAFTWSIPANQAAGPVTITFDVSDRLTSSGPTQGSFTVNVTAPVESPVIATIPTQHVSAGGTLQLNLSQYATDPNTPALALTYAMGANPPSGASLNSSSGAFHWTVPANQAAGPVTVNFTVTNGQTTAAAGSFTIDVSPAGSMMPPRVEPIPSQNATIGQAFTLNLSRFASDPNTPSLPLTYSLGAGAPAGAQIDPSTGVLTWIPPAGQPVGPTTLTVIVADNQSPPKTASANFTVDVAAPQVIPPTILPPVIKAVAQAVTATVSGAFSFDVAALAADPSTPPLPLTFSLAGAPAGVAITPAGLLTWNVPANQQLGTYPVTVVASDSSSPAKTVSETIDVAVVDNNPATVSGTA
ncbi:MAG: cadherin repeat domain-containing protein, partial [Solirubrobacteraceae bacterium]